MSLLSNLGLSCVAGSFYLCFPCALQEGGCTSADLGLDGLEKWRECEQSKIGVSAREEDNKCLRET